MRTATLVLLILALASLAVTAAGNAAPRPLLAKMIGNNGFEQDLLGWTWNVFNGCRASCDVVSDNPRSGKNCLEFSSESRVAPHVYGRLNVPVPVMPETQYELSVWVRGTDVAVPTGEEGQRGISHFTDWNVYRLDFPTGTYPWTKVSTVFRTNPGQLSVDLGVNITNKCKALAIDDISLRPIGTTFNGNGISGWLLGPSRLTGHNTQASVAVVAKSSTGANKLDVVIKSPEATVMKRRVDLKRGENQMEWNWSTGKAPFGNYRYELRVLDPAGFVVASARKDVAIVDSPLFAQIGEVEARYGQFKKLCREGKAKGIPMEYPSTVVATLDQFIPLAKEDARQGIEWRAKFAVQDFNRMLDEGNAQLRAYLADPTLAPIAKRYQTGKVTVDGLSFIGPRKDTKGNKDTGPLFFQGYGHFIQARTDIPRWPAYGVNLIQAAEFGPREVFTTEHKVDLAHVKTLIRTLDNAAKHNVRVDWLLSPHYFPQWAMQKWPHLAKGNGGFLGFCVDDPKAKEVVERFLRIVVPMIKDKPALHSICLSNEPLFINTVACDNSKPMWVNYLGRVHVNIAALNSRYGTSYIGFDEVPFPQAGTPGWYDYCIFNQERFTAWHKRMADVIHSMAPNIPTHAKVMSTELNPDFVGAGTDHELFARATELNGNDCYVFGNGGAGWSVNVWLQGASYDQQRSFARKPIFNSENHLSPDGSNWYIAPEHFTTALWQGAIHGQGATTIWVWEHSNDPHDPLYGNVMDRPGCAQAVGTSTLDLNRFAEEVTALQNTEAPAAIVYSMSSLIRNGAVYSGAVWKVYSPLSLCGIKVDFISERQLAEGKGSQYKMIILPQATHVTDAAFEAIKALPTSTKIIALGDCLSGDPYGRNRSADAVAPVKSRAVMLKDGDGETVIWPQLMEHLSKSGSLPAVSVLDAVTGKPVYGVEWLTARVGGRTVVNMVNLRDKPMDVKLSLNGLPAAATDLLSLGGREVVSTLKPATPVLAVVKE